MFERLGRCRRDQCLEPALHLGRLNEPIPLVVAGERHLVPEGEGSALRARTVDDGRSGGRLEPHRELGRHAAFSRAEGLSLRYRFHHARHLVAKHEGTYRIHAVAEDDRHREHHDRSQYYDHKRGRHVDPTTRKLLVTRDTRHPPSGT